MSKQRTYTGRSGQSAVVAELLARLCNAAVPEVDYGTDVFAFLDDREEVARLQVKTATGQRYRRGEGYSAQFSIPLAQLEPLRRPALYYVLVTRESGRFVDYLIVERLTLRTFYKGGRRFGSRDSSDQLVLNVQFRDRVRCGEIDLTEFRNAWHLLPPLAVVSGGAG